MLTEPLFPGSALAAAAPRLPVPDLQPLLDPPAAAGAGLAHAPLAVQVRAAVQRVRAPAPPPPPRVHVLPAALGLPGRTNTNIYSHLLFRYFLSVT